MIKWVMNITINLISVILQNNTLSQALPNIYVFNYLIAVSYFLNGNGRLPRRLNNPRSTINDFIFHRIISNNWSVLQQLCADKEYNKMFARSVSGVNCSRTISVLKISHKTDLSDIKAWIDPYVGRRLVMKPTHSSGKVIFLHKDVGDEDIAEFLSFSKKSFFKILRETQYANLEKKIIIEENVSPSDDATDYKFFCVNGAALYCQVDINRFTHHKRAIYSLPDFNLIDVRIGNYDLIDTPKSAHKPPNLSDMIKIAEELSSRFDFVRVDLYNIEGVTFFGELTFSPGAGSENISNEDWSMKCHNQIKQKPEGEIRCQQPGLR